MADAGVDLRTRSEPAPVEAAAAAATTDALPEPTPSLVDSANEGSIAGDFDGYMTPSAASSPYLLARSSSLSSTTPGWGDDGDYFPPMDTIGPFDLLSQIQLPAQLEKWQTSLSLQTERVRKQRERLKKTGLNAKERMVEEWRRRVATPEEQLDKYRRRMKSSVERLGKQWNDTRSVTLREKVSFIAGVLNIFISGYLIGGFPDYFYLWFTVQFFYYMPIRFFTYHARGYHYFLADLCYFVNALLLVSIWVFPHSKRLLISTYCLAYGNNAIAIAMWRNSLVFHSMDKVTSLFIHIMPPVTLHCMVHLTSAAMQKTRFPAVYAIIYSPEGNPEHYTLKQMMVWATVPYLVWQLSYHFLITVRRREKIAAGRPTSFTWLRKSYAKTWIGKIVLSLPAFLQEPAFMCIQYAYALCTIIPCPLWFWYPIASAGFLMTVFVWSIYNGATFYIDVFGRRFQKELDHLRKDIARMSLEGDPARGGSVDGSGPGASQGAPAPDGAAVAAQLLEGGPGGVSKPGEATARAVHVADTAATSGADGMATSATTRRAGTVS